ncbi:MAG: transketolase [Candidatus Thermoplasmatota archaeon]|nr:transketolase [Candidatus Thermoplasmatota archaeon]
MPVYPEELIEKLEKQANKNRQHIVEMIYNAASGHPGGSLSAVDIITALYFHSMKHTSKEPKMEDRDRFVLSKGHAAPALYACLAETGYFPVEELKTLRKLGSRLQGHPDMHKTPGVEVSTGSLGQGIGVAVGMSLAAKLDRRLCRIFCMVGDGECQEGAVWEALMASAHYKLDNLTVFLDRNQLQIDGPTERVMSLEPMEAKVKAFGWHVIQINGHNMREILAAIDESKQVVGKPTFIIAHTLKGKGVSFMEGALSFHGKAPKKDEYELAMKELREEAKRLDVKAKEGKKKPVKDGGEK